MYRNYKFLGCDKNYQITVLVAWSFTCLTNQSVSTMRAEHLLNDDVLRLLIGRYPWESDRQDAILHLGLDVFRLYHTPHQHPVPNTRNKSVVD